MAGAGRQPLLHLLLSILITTCKSARTISLHAVEIKTKRVNFINKLMLIN